jgi:hypothetical protein
MFLLPSINLELRPKLLELKAGTRIVSNTFTMGEWKPDATEEVKNSCANYCTALLWIVPARVEGSWSLPPGRLRLTQSFQMVTGSYAAWGSTTPLSSGRLRGNRLTFSAAGTQYDGLLKGDTVEGTATARGKKQPFKATRVKSAQR